VRLPSHLFLRGACSLQDAPGLGLPPFPDGKDQLIAAGIQAQGLRAIGMLNPLERAPPPDVAAGSMAMWWALLTTGDFTSGCSLVAVTVSSGDTDLLSKAGEIFRAWRGRLAELIADGWLRPEAASPSPFSFRCSLPNEMTWNRATLLGCASRRRCALGRG
jgi:hypothetical protein